MIDEDNPITHIFALIRDINQKILDYGIRLDKIEFDLRQVTKDEKENSFNAFRGEE